MAEILVTGVNGFIGSHLAELLLARGDHVTGLVRATSDLRSLAPLFRTHGARLRIVVGDVRDSGSLAAAVADVQIVYHLAAVVMGTSEEEFRASIVDGTRNMMAAARRAGTVQRFLHVSSQAAAGPSPTEQSIDEAAVASPVSWYGTAKRDAEELLRASEGLKTTIVRPVAVYGERETDLSGGTFPAVAAGFLPHIGFGDKRVSMIYVGDLVRGMVAAAESPAAVGRTYFLADPQPCPAGDVVSAAADALKPWARIPIVVPHFVLSLVAAGAQWAHAFSRRRPRLTCDKVREVRQRFWCASPAAAKRDFGWSAQVPLADGMRRAVVDWRERKSTENRVTDEPARDRAVKTYSLAVLCGVLNESVAHAAHWYEFNPAWLIFVVAFGAFGAGLGFVSYVTARVPAIVQFLAGAGVFAFAEIANHFWLHTWTFADEPFGKWGLWTRTLILAVPIGLVPVVINAIVRCLYGLRRRVG